MARMPETIAALQEGRAIRVARLVRLDFASTTMRLHQGVGPLRTGDGQTWQGLGKLGQISDIDRAVLPTGGAPTLTLSGVDPDLIAKALASASEVKGQPVRIFDQHYDDALALLDEPFAIFVGLMDRMTIADSGTTAAITVECVSLLYRRRRPAYGYLNASSQRRLHPGDRGADEIAGLVQKAGYWPAF